MEEKPMKAIQVTFDEALLARLDRHPMVRERGRSAVLREAAAGFLRRAETQEIDRKYREGYADAAELEDALVEWADQGVWREE